MIEKKISEQVLVAIESVVINSKHLSFKNQEHESDVVNDFIKDFKQELDNQGILRVEVLSKWIKI